MSGLFSTINIGVSALLSQRQAIDVRAHNIANSNTDGYRRQEALLGAVPGAPPAGNMNALLGGQWGAGVRAIAVTHSHESYLDLQARLSDAALGRWSMASDMLHQVETVLQTAPGEDLSARLDQFWNAWEAVAVQPEDIGARYALREQAKSLCDAFRDGTAHIQSLRLTADTGIRERIEEANTIIAEVVKLNRTIATALAEKRAPNDDLDRRDLLLNRLAELTGAMPFTSEGGPLMVYLDGRPLIEGNRGYSLSLTTTTEGVEIRTSYDDEVVEVAGGEIGGLVYARDVCLPHYLDELDSLAGELIARVNELHRQGYGLDNVGDRDFFLPDGTAGTISLTADILSDVRAIAAAADLDSPGDGSIANQIAALRGVKVSGEQTLNGMAQALLGMIGGDVRTADFQIEAYRAGREQIRVQQQAISGVNTDEEMAYLMELQRAYEAAARIVRVGDELLGVVIEQLGV